MKTVSEINIERTPNVKLRDLRQKHGLSMKEVADAVGIPQFQYMRAECGRAMLTVNAVKIAKFFETTVEKLWAEAL